jgi:hypothetical protein
MKLLISILVLAIIGIFVTFQVDDRANEELSKSVEVIKTLAWEGLKILIIAAIIIAAVLAMCFPPPFRNLRD